MWYKYHTFIFLIPNPTSRASWKIFCGLNDFFPLLIFSIWHLSHISGDIFSSLLLLFTFPAVGWVFLFFIELIHSILILMFSFSVWLVFVYNSSHSIICINNVSFVLIITPLLAISLCLHSSVVALATSVWIFCYECCLLLDNIVLSTIAYFL